MAAMRRIIPFSAIYLCLFMNTVIARAEVFWPQWRGPEFNGVAREGNPPVEWSEDKNIRWKTEIPGLGSASPIIWGDCIFVQTAIETSQVVEPPQAEAAPPAVPAPQQEGGRGQRGGGRSMSSRPNRVYQFALLCIDRTNGEVLWQKVLREEVPHEGKHQTGSFASNSPCTDGVHVYAFFGSRGLYCLDMEGNVKWEKDIGQMTIRREFGEGSSPYLYRDKLIINWDHQGDSFITVLDKTTGEEIWRTPRDEESSWATPLVVEHEGAAQIVIPAAKFSRGYHLETGEVIWQCAGMTNNTIPSPVAGNGLVYLTSGFRGSSLQAIRLSEAKGDITGSAAVAWTHNKGTPYVPSPLLYDGTLYFLGVNSGLVSCFDAKNGTPHYEPQRLPEVSNVYSSPVGAAGHVYITSREGVTVVLRHGPQFEVVSVNKLNDGFDASAAIVGDALYLRGKQYLYRMFPLDRKL